MVRTLRIAVMVLRIAVMVLRIAVMAVATVNVDGTARRYAAWPDG